MPFFSYNQTESSGGSFSAANDTSLKLGRGIISHLEIEFPAGCAGLMRCQLFYGPRQLIPANDTGYLASNDHVVQINTRIPLLDEPLRLMLKSWNIDDTYDHTIQIRINVQDPAELGMTSKDLDDLVKLFASLQVGQEIPIEEAIIQ